MRSPVMSLTIPVSSIQVPESRYSVAGNLRSGQHRPKNAGSSLWGGGYRVPEPNVLGCWMDVGFIEKVGFKYDSSVCVNSLYNKTDSDLKGVCSYPYNPQQGLLEPGDNRSFIEFPWSYLDICGFKIPPSGGPCCGFSVFYHCQRFGTEHEERAYGVLFSSAGYLPGEVSS